MTIPFKNILFCGECTNVVQMKKKKKLRTAQMLLLYKQLDYPTFK